MNIFSKSDLDLVLTEVELLLGCFHGLKDKGIKYALQNRVRKSTAEMFKDASESQLRKIKTQLENSPVVGLTLAFEPTILQLKIMVDWLRENGVPDCILDVKVDPRIIVGATISYKGKYKDLSFSTEYDKISTFP